MRRTREEFEDNPIEPNFEALKQDYANFCISRFVSRRESAVDPACVHPRPACFPDKEELHIIKYYLYRTSSLLYLLSRFLRKANLVRSL